MKMEATTKTLSEEYKYQIDEIDYDRFRSLLLQLRQKTQEAHRESQDIILELEDILREVHT